MVRIISQWMIIGFLALGLGQASGPLVAIIKVADHPALDQTVEGIKQALKDQGFGGEGKGSIAVYSAQGNVVLARQIMAMVATKKPAAVVAVGTLVAQAAMPVCRLNKIPLVYSSVTDPRAARLLDHKGKALPGITGVSNFIPVGDQMDALLKLMPNLKKLGMIYNAAEANSFAILLLMQKECKKKGITLIAQALQKTTEVTQALQKMMPHIDVMFINNDNLALSVFPLIVKVMTKAGKPVFVSDTDLVAGGAMAALGPNQFEIGAQTGRMVGRILKGIVPEKICMEGPQKIEFVINLDVAKKMDITVDQKVRQMAATLYEEGKRRTP